MKSTRRSWTAIIGQMGLRPAKVARAVAMVAATLLSGCHGADAPGDSGYRSWRSFGGASDGSSYTDLDQITPQNVSKLELAWSYPTGDDQLYAVSPIVVDRTVYTFAKKGAIVAINAVTGQELWSHPAPEGASPMRGLSYWQNKDGSDRRIFVTWNSKLYAIDASTGELATGFGKDGEIDLKEGLDRDPVTIQTIHSRGPGRVFENLIILGSAPGEDYLAAPGDIRAYNVVSGKLVWTFHTIPRPGEFGYDTWPKDAYKYSGAANAWGDLTLDEKRGILFAPTGSATYDFYGADRPGNNLFANSVLALDARTGKRIWHAQTVHHDLTDYDNVAGPQILSAKINGRDRRIVAFAGKTGFLYVYDEETGKPVWPIEERPVPRSRMTDERDSPTQPFPTMPAPFARQKFTAKDLNPYILTPAERDKWAKVIGSARNDGLFSPPESGRLTLNMPGHSGGAGLFAVSSNPKTGEMYVVSFDGPSFLQLRGSAEETLDNNWKGPGISAWYGCEGVCKEQVRMGTSETAAPPLSTKARDAGRVVFMTNCQACHGERLQGGVGPSIVGVTGRLKPDTIRSILHKGQGQMPAFPGLADGDVSNLLAFLGDTGLKKDANSNNSENRPYPVGAFVPGGGKRYFSGWGFAPALIGPPWSTLTAYDLNTGRIKWQVPYGEAMGVAPAGNNFGILQFHGPKASPTITATGLLITATPDAKLRAWDKNNGKVIWTVKLPDRAGGIPAVYEVDGREYVLISVRGQYRAYALPASEVGR